MPTQMLTNQKLIAERNEAFTDPSLYMFIVTELQYATITRPDISFVVNKVSQFMYKPLEVH